MVIRELLKIDHDGPKPWAPKRVKAQWESLEGRTWASEYRSELSGPPEVVGPFLRNATDGLTYPLTILWGLEKLKKDDSWTRKDTLVIHVSFCVLVELVYDCMRALIDSRGNRHGGDVSDGLRGDHAPSAAG